MVSPFEDTNICVIHAKKVMIMLKDIPLAWRIKGHILNTSKFGIQYLIVKSKSTLFQCKGSCIPHSSDISYPH